MMTPELLDPRHCVVNNLHKTARAVGRVYAEAMRPAGVTRSQFAVLGHLEADGALAISDLARRLVMDRTTVTRNLRPLEQAGLVVRSASADDARVRLVAITDAGRERLREARGYWRQAQARVLERFGDAAWRDLEATLRDLRRLVR
ncbi:MAG: MarR family winged helix-turn-helix transcriptional regulator [Pseudomonadales bacterium]